MNIPDNIYAIAEQIRTQDNLATDAPIFLVQKIVRHYGSDRGIGDEDRSGYCYINKDVEISQEEYERRKRSGLDDDGGLFYDGDWEEVEFIDRWEYVTACFTRKGAEDYIAANGHNLGETRIWCDTSYRNDEMRAVRKFLMELRAPAPVQPDICPHCKQPIVWYSRPSSTCGCKPDAVTFTATSGPPIEIQAKNHD